MKLGFIGAGNMAQAIIGGILKKGIYSKGYFMEWKGRFLDQGEKIRPEFRK